MASNNALLVFVTFVILFSITTTSSSNSPETLPVPPPETDPDDSPIISSPYAFPPANLSPVSASIPSSDMSPAQVAIDTAAGNEPTNSSSRRMKNGKKAGIAIGVVAVVCVVGLGGVLCKKRKQNVRRAQFSYSV